MSSLRMLLTYLLFTLCAPTLLAQTLPADVLKAKTLARIEAFDQTWDGVLGVEAIDLTTGQRLSFNSQVVFPQASVIKIPIMIETFRQIEAGRLKLDDEIEIASHFLVAGSGRFQQEMAEGIPLRKPLREVINAMMVWSDNVATNVLIDLVSKEGVNRMLKAQRLGYTRLQRVMMDGEAVARNDENIATPAEMARLVQLLYEATLTNEAARDTMITIMSGVQGEMRKAIPAGYQVASKTGEVPAVRGETGLVLLDERPFVLSVMSTYNGPGNPTPVGDITRIVFDYFERLAHANLYGHRTNIPLQ